MHRAEECGDQEAREEGTDPLVPVQHCHPDQDDTGTATAVAGEGDWCTLQWEEGGEERMCPNITTPLSTLPPSSIPSFLPPPSLPSSLSVLQDTADTVLKSYTMSLASSDESSDESPMSSPVKKTVSVTLI